MKALEYLKIHETVFLERYTEFLSVPSVSSLSEHKNDVLSAADFVKRNLERIGLQRVALMPTKLFPVVYGEYIVDPGKPTVLIYGHYDVQPADPLDLWDSPPFKPQIRNDRIYARGATDNKGNIFLAICAVEALIISQELTFNVKFIIEGQEEIGSPQMDAFIQENKSLLACDYVLNADTSQYDEHTPGLTLSLRGLCALEINVTTAAGDMHSGTHGGTAPNPIDIVCRLVSGLKTPDGNVSVPGFYDGVDAGGSLPLDDYQSVPFNEAVYQKKYGLKGLTGERGYAPLVRNWLRPTLECNGITGGFQGEGVKTVLPAKASLKITCRLVNKQDPNTIAELVKQHILSLAPDNAWVDVAVKAGGGFPYSMDRNHPGNKIAAQVLTEVYGCDPLYIGSGGSIPIIAYFDQILGVKSVGFGFALNDENQHAPNEFFRLSSFRKGMNAFVKFLSA